MRDEIEGVAVTCIDNGMPVVCVAARRRRLRGDEEPAEIEANATPARRGAIRLAAGELMNLGDVTNKTVPKVSLLSTATRRGVSTRGRSSRSESTKRSASSAPSRSPPPASFLGRSPTRSPIAAATRPHHSLDIEHPTGYFSVALDVDVDGERRVVSVRRARCAPRDSSCAARSSCPTRFGPADDHRLPRPLHDGTRAAQRVARASGRGLRGGRAAAVYPAISDDQIAETIEKNQLRLLRERGADLTIFSPRASAMEHHVGDESVSLAWSRACNDLIARVATLFPETFVGVCQLPQSPGVPIDALDRRTRALRARARIRRGEPEPGPERRALERTAR